MAIAQEKKCSGGLSYGCALVVVHKDPSSKLWGLLGGRAVGQLGGVSDERTSESQKPKPKIPNPKTQLKKFNFIPRSFPLGLNLRELVILEAFDDVSQGILKDRAEKCYCGTKEQGQ